MIQLEVDEVLALRTGVVYELHEQEPETGRYWAIRAIPCEFPGPHHQSTRDGVAVTQLVIAIAERRRDNGLWQWCHATMACKRLFGDLLLDNAQDPTRWHYIEEILG